MRVGRIAARVGLKSHALFKIVGRILKLLTRRGALVEEQDSLYVADDDGDSDDARALRPLQSAACTYRIAFGSRAGYKLSTVPCAMPRKSSLEQELCAEMQGFSLGLHVAARCEPDDRHGVGTTVPLHHSSHTGLRPGAMQRRRAGWC